MSDTLRSDYYGVTEYATNPSAPHSQFVTEVALAGCHQIGMFVVEHCAPGHYPDPPMDEYNLQWITRANAPCEFDLGVRRVNGHLESGDALFAPPDVSCDYVVDGYFSLITLGLPKRLFATAASALNGGHFPDFEQLHSDMITDPRLEHFAQMIRLQSSAGTPDGGLFVDQAAYLLAGILMDKAAKITRTGRTARPLSDHDLRRVVDLMHDQLENGVALEALAAHVGRDVYGFTRAFRLKVGIPPYKYMIFLRLRTAWNMIAYSRKTLAEIALSCGFCDQAHMSALFRKHFDTTPLTLRRALQI